VRRRGDGGPPRQGRYREHERRGQLAPGGDRQRVDPGQSRTPRWATLYRRLWLRCSTPKAL
jgi:hypothetical protein